MQSLDFNFDLERTDGQRNFWRWCSPQINTRDFNCFSPHVVLVKTKIPVRGHIYGNFKRDDWRNLIKLGNSWAHYFYFTEKYVIGLSNLIGMIDPDSLMQWLYIFAPHGYNLKNGLESVDVTGIFVEGKSFPTHWLKINGDWGRKTDFN